MQRIPPTEKRGRVHSSTVTVAVIDLKEIKRIEFNDHDFRIEWYSGTGPGGQHRNKTQNSCRIIHIPTRIICTASCRSRENSLAEAKTAILERLNRKQSSMVAEELYSTRKEQVGSGMRGDKMRTYRFQDNTVKDHASGIATKCDKVLNGYFDIMW